MILAATLLHTRDLLWTSATSSFVAEASELPAPSRVFDDAADVGYTIVSETSGVGMVYVLAETVRDTEGDLLYEVYRPVDQSIARTSLVVYND